MKYQIQQVLQINQLKLLKKNEKLNEWLSKVKIEYVNNGSVNKCKWCPAQVQCEKKSQEKLANEVSIGKSTKKLLLSNLNLAENPFYQFMSDTIKIELYKCPEFCSLKCEHDYRKAGY